MTSPLAEARERLAYALDALDDAAAELDNSGLAAEILESAMTRIRTASTTTFVAHGLTAHLALLAARQRLRDREAHS